MLLCRLANIYNIFAVFIFITIVLKIKIVFLITVVKRANLKIFRNLQWKNMSPTSK